jgi:hypothetical protein
LAIFQIGGEFPDGFLAVVNSCFILQMCIEPVCEMLLADRGCGAVDVLEERVFAKYVQIKDVLKFSLYGKRNRIRQLTGFGYEV